MGDTILAFVLSFLPSNVDNDDDKAMVDKTRSACCERRKNHHPSS
jgi:hypothetical protein